jgi:hemoglobin
MTLFISVRRVAPFFVAVGLATAAPALSGTMPTNPAGAAPIRGDRVFRAFHGEEGIDRIIDDFVGRITTDPRISERFQNANLVRLRLELKAQVCYLTGGPCEYTGKDMKTAHAGMGLENRDFNALAEDLQKSMDRERVSFPAQNRLLARLAPMQRAIVSK